MKKIKIRILKSLRLTNQPFIRVYNGYGNKTNFILYGHAFLFGPLPRKRYRNMFLINAFALLRLFMVKIKKGALVRLTWQGEAFTTRSEADGFFKFEWKPAAMPAAGYHDVEVSLLDDKSENILYSTKGMIIVPHDNPFAIISDIDDTFLVSYSSNLRKRLFVLLTENALSRKPFESVVSHYQLLAKAQAPANSKNPFFYVSSSEWNLYDYIKDFSAKYELPQGVYLLSQLKRFSQVFKTGQNNHATKFMRIARVLEAYPNYRFILLGDDSQEDPNIYASVTDHFQSRIFCIYIRKVNGTAKPAVEEKLRSLAPKGVQYCYFEHSAEAILHSRAIGLVSSE